MSRAPITTWLPGAAHVKPQIEASHSRGTFKDKSGSTRSFDFDLQLGGDAPFLTIIVDDGSVCTFNPNPEPRSSSWSAQGLKVVTQRQGIGTAIYAIARDLLLPRGHAIAPSDNLWPDGVKLWSRLDPSIQMEQRPDMPGYFRPRHSAPPTKHGLMAAVAVLGSLALIAFIFTMRR
jgi:hypothetical protein